MPRHAFITVLAALMLAASHQAHAVEPGEALPDATLERRARSISAELRCLVCQNQSIDDSNAPLAKDLRLLVRERLSTGDTDAAVVSFIVARYGQFVLLKPPFDASTLLLWLTPGLCLAGLAVARWRTLKTSQPTTAPAPLSPSEERQLASLLAQKPNRRGT